MVTAHRLEADCQPTSASTSAWRDILLRTGLVYLFSRVCVMVGAGIVAAELRADVNRATAEFPNTPIIDPDYAGKVIPKSGMRLILDVLMSWDGLWYQRIIERGYPHHVRPNVTYEVADARAAFFPAYPGLVRIVDRVMPGGSTVAALGVNFILGAVAVLLTGLLARELFDERIARRTMYLMCLFPGAFVLSFAYTEALLICAAAGCLLALVKRQWVLAGVLAALGTATRPNGIALIAACAVAGYLAIRNDREWRALVAVALAPVGFVAFQLWLWHHTGERTVWFRVQTEAWGEGASFGYTALRRSVLAFVHPLSSPTNTITALSVLATVVLLWFLWQHRLPPAVTAYVVVVLALMLLPATVTARPRFLYTAFPLLISAGVWFERRDRTNPDSDAWPLSLAACSAGLVGLVGLFGVFGAIP